MELHSQQAIERTSQEQLDFFIGEGITGEIILDAVKAGYATRNEYVAPCYAKTAAGTVAYHVITGEIRRPLMELSWEPSNDFNFPTIISPNRQNAITVGHGYFTNGEVRTAGKKGRMTANAIRTNKDQLSLFPGLWPSGVPKVDTLRKDEQLLWYLLHDFDDKTGIVSYRLVVPLHIHNGEIIEWDEERQIIFESFNIFGNEVDATRITQPVAEEIDIPVMRKQ